MGFFDSLQSAFNPDIIDAFNDLYYNHYEALDLYVRGGYENYIDKNFHTPLHIYLSDTMSFENKKLLVEAKEDILHQYKREQIYLKAQSIIEKCPNGIPLVMYKEYNITITDACETARKALNDYKYEETKKQIDELCSFSFGLNLHNQGTTQDHNPKYKPQNLTITQTLDVFDKEIVDHEIEILKEEENLKEKVLEWSDKNNKRIISQAKSLARLYTNGYKNFVNFPIDNMSLEQAKMTLACESKIKRYNGLSNRIKNNISTWTKLFDIPYYFFYYYYPLEKCPYVSGESERARKMIWNFKDGRSEAQHSVKQMLVKKLSDTFDEFDRKYLTLVCIPASTVYSHIQRYKSFSEIVCKELGMINGFEHIRITREKTEAHLGGTDKSLYSFDESFFKGKNIILFDDVVTRGTSMLEFRQELEHLGSHVICSVSIGRTCFPDNTNAHPWSGMH